MAAMSAAVAQQRPRSCSALPRQERFQIYGEAYATALNESTRRLSWSSAAPRQHRERAAPRQGKIDIGLLTGSDYEALTGIGHPPEPEIINAITDSGMFMVRGTAVPRHRRPEGKPIAWERRIGFVVLARYVFDALGWTSARFSPIFSRARATVREGARRSAAAQWAAGRLAGLSR